MARKTVQKPYAKPALQKRQRLTDVTESDSIIVTGSAGVKGGCFSKSR